MSEKSSRYPFVVEPFQEDFMGEMSWPTLGNLLLRCANLHASEHGFGFVQMDNSLYVWVLSRLVVEMKRMPRSGEKFTIETWVRSAYRLFTDRCFAILDEEERPLGYAYSIWALINKETRETIEMSRIVTPEFQNCIDAERACPLHSPGRIRVKADQPRITQDTYYSDIDINNHVNSIRYIEHMLDLFPKSYYESFRVSRIEMAYNEETYCGEPLSYYVQDSEENEAGVEVRKNVDCGEKANGTVVCRGKFSFCERGEK